jgi:hypothetical protein
MLRVTFSQYIERQPFEMSTTLCEMRLFNDASQKHDTSFILNGKESGKCKPERERERENRSNVGGGV